MFFVIGVSSERKQLDFSQLAACKYCGKEGRLEVFEEYNVLKFFCVQTVRWNRRYYAVLNCCSARCELDRETGEKIENGLRVDLNPNEMHFTGGDQSYCPSCGYPIQADFEFCPKCGKDL